MDRFISQIIITSGGELNPPIQSLNYIYENENLIRHH